MFKTLRAIKDAYITDRIINGQAQLTANVGAGGSLDLYKLYGFTSTVSGSTTLPNTELTRLLVQFDTAPLQELWSNGLIDITNPSFSCVLHLYDVYGGQPTPSNFAVTINPLSASFDEGGGRDVVYYSDSDVCNWLSSSYASGSWLMSGCAQGGDDSGPCDYLTASANVGNLTFTQFFNVGTEDLKVDITPIISASLAELIPNVGLRIAFSPSLESDVHTYFVKRFASRTAFNSDLHPKLHVRFNDSIQDDTLNLHLDSTGYLFLHNYVGSSPSNLASGSTYLSGSNCILLQLTTPVSGATYTLDFVGSQHSSGVNPQVGIYSASVKISSNDPLLMPQWQASGSITFTPTWTSLDGTITYLQDKPIKVLPSQCGSQSIDPKKFEVTVLGLPDTLNHDEQTVLRVNIFDYTQPYLLQATRLPVELPGIIVRNVHYQVRDPITGLIPIPFDVIKNSTLVSNDSVGMYFTLDVSNLTVGRSYVIDIMIVSGNNKQLYPAISTTFRVACTS